MVVDNNGGTHTNRMCSGAYFPGSLEHMNRRGFKGNPCAV